MAESTHDILNRLIVLKGDGVVANFALYDNACHCHQSVKKHNVKALEDIEWVVDRFHEVNHKCTAYAADQHSALEGVNTESCEQLFAWLRRFKYIFITMNAVRAFFLMWNVLEAHNRYLHAGQDPQAIVAWRSDPGEREERRDEISTWIICIQETVLARNISRFLLRNAAILHSAMARATPIPATPVAYSPFESCKASVTKASVSRRKRVQAEQSSPNHHTSSPPLKRRPADYAVDGTEETDSISLQLQFNCLELSAPANDSIKEGSDGDRVPHAQNQHAKPQEKEKNPAILIRHHEKEMDDTITGKLVDLGVDPKDMKLWDADAEDPAFQQLRTPPCGMDQKKFHDVCNTLITKLRGKVPLLQRSTLKCLFGKGMNPPSAREGKAVLLHLQDSGLLLLTTKKPFKAPTPSLNSILLPQSEQPEILKHHGVTIDDWNGRRVKDPPASCLERVKPATAARKSP